MKTLCLPKRIPGIRQDAPQDTAGGNLGLGPALNGRWNSASSGVGQPFDGNNALSAQRPSMADNRQPPSQVPIKNAALLFQVNGIFIPITG